MPMPIKVFMKKSRDTRLNPQLACLKMEMLWNKRVEPFCAFTIAEKRLDRDTKTCSSPNFVRNKSLPSRIGIVEATGCVGSPVEESRWKHMSYITLGCSSNAQGIARRDASIRAVRELGIRRASVLNKQPRIFRDSSSCD